MIHSLRKRTIRNRIERENQNRVETRDAILWDVIPSQRLCRVKIQGSNNLIECRYPENWSQTPKWMKPGNSVRVQHRGGNRHSVEVVGNGLFVPTPTVNSSTGVTNPAAPVVSAGLDAIISGCQIYAMVDELSMQVWVETGVYRISGTQYTLGAMSMHEENTTTMASGVPMGETAAIIDIYAAHATLWRMDSLVVGADGVIDVLIGDNSATFPQLPETPSGHVQIGWVQIPPATACIAQYLINAPFVEPFPSLITSSVDNMEMHWEEETKVITLEVKDQYGRRILGEDFRIACTITGGTGTIYPATAIINSSTGTATLIYRRVEGYNTFLDPVEELGPVYLKYNLVINPGVEAIGLIILLNIGHEPIYGTS